MDAIIADCLALILEYTVDTLHVYRNCILVCKQWKSILQPQVKWFMKCQLYWDPVLVSNDKVHVPDKMMHVWKLVTQSGLFPHLQLDRHFDITPLQRSHNDQSKKPDRKVDREWLWNISLIVEPYCVSTEDLDLLITNSRAGIRYLPIPPLRLYSFIDVSSNQHSEVLSRNFVDSEDRKCRLITWSQANSHGYASFICALRLYSIIHSIDSSNVPALQI